MMKQFVIVRNDLHMSRGRIAAQVSHASIMCLLSNGNWNGESFNFHSLPKSVLNNLTDG